MSPRYDVDWIDKLLDTSSRFGSIRPEDLLVRSGLDDGHIVADLGCGPGLLAFAASSIVGQKGKVYAVDIEPKMTDMVRTRAEQEGAGNIVTVLSTGDSIPLADELADYVICSQVLHYPDVWEERVKIVREAARILRPSGRVLIIEWLSREDSTASASNLTPERVEEVLSLVGFHNYEQLSLGDRQYGVLAYISA